LNIPATSARVPNFLKTGCANPRELVTNNSPLRTMIAANTGTVATAVVYTRSIIPSFGPDTDFFITTVSMAVVNEDQMPHAIPTVEVPPTDSPDTPDKNPIMVIKQAIRARTPGRELGRNATESPMVNGRSNPRAI